MGTENERGQRVPARPPPRGTKGVKGWSAGRLFVGPGKEGEHTEGGGEGGEEVPPPEDGGEKGIERKKNGGEGNGGQMLSN